MQEIWSRCSGSPKLLQKWKPSQIWLSLCRGCKISLQSLHSLEYQPVIQILAVPKMHQFKHYTCQSQGWKKKKIIITKTPFPPPCKTKTNYSDSFCSFHARQNLLTYFSFLFQCFNDHSLQCSWCDLEMEKKWILFDEMDLKSVPNFGYRGRRYTMLLASIKLELQGIKMTPKRLLLFHTGHVLVVCRIVFLSQKIHTHVYIFSSHILWYTYMYGQRVFPFVCVVYEALNSTFPGHNPTLVRHAAPPVFHANTKIHVLQHHSSQFIQMHMYIMYRPYTDVGGLAS